MNELKQVKNVDVPFLACRQLNTTTPEFKLMKIIAY